MKKGRLALLACALGGTFEVTCSVTRDGRVVYAQVVPGAPLSDNDIESLDASGYCSNKSAN